MISHVLHEEDRQERLFDKPRIIMHSRNILLRLRRHKILVDDIVEAINAHGVPMTRARFEDLFTSRPYRVVIATPTVFLVLVSVSFNFHPTVLSASELIDFADAARLPLRFYDQLSVYFRTQEWQEAWFGLLPTTKPFLNRHFMVHRDQDFKRALQAYDKQHHILVTGPAGVGKTAFAQSLLLEIEMLSGTKMPALHLDKPIASVHDLIVAIAHASNIRPLHDEPIELRLQSVLPTLRATYVFIDNVHCADADCTVLRRVAQLFPRMRFIVTTPECESTLERLVAQIGPSTVTSLTPLRDTTTDSPAMMLFVQTLSSHGVPYANSEILALHEICKRGNGIPREIMRLALQQRKQIAQTPQCDARDALAKLNYHQMKVLSVLSRFRQPVSDSFLSTLSERFAPGVNLSEVIAILRESNLIELQLSETQTTYRLHTATVHAYQQMFTPLHLAAERAEHLDLMSRCFESAEVAVIAALSQHDIKAIIELLSDNIFHDPSAVFEVAKLISAGLQVWLYHDVSSEIILIIEQILLQHSAAHPAIAELCVIAGRIYNTRAQYARALELQEMVRALLSPQNHATMMARSLFVQLSAFLSTQNSTAIASLDSQVLAAWTHLETNDTTTWQNYARIPLSYWYCGRDDIAQARQICTRRDLLGKRRVLTADGISLEFQNSLIHMMEGSYDIAKAILLNLSNELKPFDVPYYVASLEMRLAATEALMHNLDDAVLHIRQSFNVLKCVGNVTELLFVADIYSLIQFRRQAFHSAQAISMLCGKLHADYGMLRMGFIERLVNTKRAKIPAWVLDSIELPDKNSTIYDLITMLTEIRFVSTPKEVFAPAV